MTKKASGKRSGGKKSENSKTLQPGPSKNQLEISKPQRVSVHKFRAEWFQDRASWPWREN